ncbi:hypothetical protein [Halostagnicola bangensis]
MRRRKLLAACGCGVLGTSTAGCLESLRREDAWRELVVDPPAGIYVPPKIDEMTTDGLETADEYAVALFATRPHSFWTVTGDEQSRADLRSDHAIHLMASVWDEETEMVLPTGYRGVDSAQQRQPH